MNRTQRRKQMRKIPKYQSLRVELIKQELQSVSDFSGVPVETLCQSINLLINELRARGFPAYDFDHKDKIIYGIKIIRNKVCFLLAHEVKMDGKEKE